MTLARTALRLATVAALQGGNAATGPTIARNRVYDSRISDFSPESYPSDALPSIIVLTDDDEGDALSRQNGGPPFQRLVKLVIEFAMVQGFDVPFGEDGTEFVPGYPVTDSEHEASLDLLEFQIKQRLAYDLDSFCAIWRSFTRPVKFDCHRQVLDETGVKLAARILTWECLITDDMVKVYNPELETLPSGFDLLPEPLKRVANALPAGKLRNVCTAIAQVLNPLQASPLDGIDFRITQGDEDPGMDVTVEIRSALDVPVTIGNGAVVIDYARGTFQNLILTGNVTSMTVINWPRSGKTGRLILQTTNTGNFAIAWPDATEWALGVVGEVSQGAGKKDIFILTTASGGDEIFGNVVGRDYH